MAAAQIRSVSKAGTVQKPVFRHFNAETEVVSDLVAILRDTFFVPKGLVRERASARKASTEA